ncbi:enoyl-CoA hydratase [Bauldia litoralis]|uniref:enoyl-CoA hydratase n=1 Tax=Bauldia litoralis TaxID=665467 RepID=A0A1G6E169_9HYPH|nr:enoyl-CoA hydratase [Bauldia litoralis]SDB51187.1 enoyl-CoA hydratase [Bauldia litoralis]
MAYQTITTETRGPIGLITLNRPKVLNALNTELIGELCAAVDGYEADPKIGCMVITGSDKAFAAGADIKEMSDLTYIEAFSQNFGATLERIGKARKPIVAAVAGYCLGGGAELAMQCDIIIAAETAKFGQPEITLGIMPGMGGTQRLPRAIGKAKAMDMILTGRMMDAAEADSSGLVSRVVPAGDLLEEAIKVAEKIADHSLPIVMLAKESVNRSFETTLSEGVQVERRLFHSMFATGDQKEGMAAFLAKRSPQFRNR